MVTTANPPERNCYAFKTLKTGKLHRRSQHYLYIELMDLLEKALDPIIIPRVMK